MCPRPPELENKLEKRSKDIDEAIINVLTDFETGKQQKKNITAKIIAKQSGCSEGAINLPSRQWARDRMKRIKEKRKNKSNAENSIEKSQPDKLESLRQRVANLLEQNAYLYEDVLALKESNDRLTRENKELAKGKGKLVKKSVKLQKTLVVGYDSSNINVIDMHKRKDK